VNRGRRLALIAAPTCLARSDLTTEPTAMRAAYDHDVFISYDHRDTRKVRPIFELLRRAGLRVFFDKDNLKSGQQFNPELSKAVLNSQHFVLYLSEKAASSSWVEKEWTLFHDSCHLTDSENRLMYVLLDEPRCKSSIPPLLSLIQRPESKEQLVAALAREFLTRIEADLKQAQGNQGAIIARLESQLEQEQRKVGEARGYYKQNRLWGPIARNKDVHIFTCARDVPHNTQGARGYGGRTNIDMWDYRAVLDISHFFASNYPSARVRIEDPVSKLQGKDLEGVPALATHMADMSRMLENKDCIIIGSPDVSDFAELVLAKLHNINAYTEGREKRKGFVIIKEQQQTRSSFYWAKSAAEEEGVVQILGDGDYRAYPNVPAVEGKSPGKMYGILVIANNPFRNADDRRDESARKKVVILSGFSGVATNAIAKILTDDDCLEEFFKLDDAYSDIDKDVEVLIGVEYEIEKNFDTRDTRRIKGIKSITFEGLVEI
jgi:hypothetical protein